MTGIDPERLQRRLRWASDQLGLDQDASVEQVRAAWLRLLPDEDFVPPEEWRWALAALLHQKEGAAQKRADAASSLAEEERLREEIEEFAEAFWESSPEERRQRWQELLDQCAFAPALSARLRLLEAGLDLPDLPGEAEEDKDVVELAGYIRDLFVLRPLARACLRQSIVQRTEQNWAWNGAAGRLRQAYPALAELGKDLLDKLEAPPRPSKGSKKAPRTREVASTTEKPPFPHETVDQLIERSDPQLEFWDWKVPLLVLCVAIAVIGGVFWSAPRSSSSNAQRSKRETELKRLLEGVDRQKKLKDRSEGVDELRREWKKDFEKKRLEPDRRSP